MLINKLLSGAVKLWLYSQVSEIKNLKITVSGKDRQILRGDIPKILISASNALYRGIYLSKIETLGTNIKFDLSQVVNQKSLKLLEPIEINIQALLLAKDLQRSLSSSLLSAGLTDIWHQLLSLPTATVDVAKKYNSYQWNYLSFASEEVAFKGIYSQSNINQSAVGIQTKIKLFDQNSLMLAPLAITTIPELPIAQTQPLIFNLGEQVSIKQLEITQEHLFVQGTITVYP